MPLNSLSFARSLVLAIVLFCAGAAHAQSGELVSGSILIQIAPSATAQVAAAFQSVRPANDPTFRNTDIHNASLVNDEQLRSLLGLPNKLRGLSLKPYSPTHSIALEDIREHSNPELFNQQNVGRTSSSDNLRQAEEKLSRWFILSFDSNIAPQTAVALAKKSSRIQLAEPRYPRYPCLSPNDSLFFDQYALKLMHVPEAWDVVACDSNMVIADDDVGADWTHEDLRNAIYLNKGEIGLDTNDVDKRANGVDDDGNGFIDDWHGWDFFGSLPGAPDNDARPGDPSDPFSGSNHGTHTTGIMAATPNNKVGIAGVTFGARVIPIKVSNNFGGELLFGFEGIIYAADMHAKAVNCSWGGPTRSQAEQDVVEYAYAKDCAVVAAAGNNGIYQDFYPAAYHHVLSVAAAEVGDNIAGYSNFNTHVSVSAPGTNVWSTVIANQYALETGTSMASPNACGVLALVRQRFPWMSAGEAMQQVRATTDTLIVDESKRDLVGHGLLNAFKAVTDTGAHSARIESIFLADDNGSGAFEPGETGGIVLDVKNFLNPVHELYAVVRPIEGAEWISLHDSIVALGPADRMQTIQSIQAGLRVRLADSVPANTVIVMRVAFRDSTVGYGPDIDYFSFVVNPSYLDLDKNNIRATFSSKGSIGFNDVVQNSQGSGLIWQHAPPSILPLAKSVLFQGGLMAGVQRTLVSSLGEDSVAHFVVDVVEGNNDNFANEDFRPVTIVRNVTPDHPNAVQELETSFSDNLTDTAFRVGLNVTERAYAFNTGLSANAVVVKYILRRSSFSRLTDSSAAGLFFDWDIGLSGALNVTHFDTGTSSAITNRLEKGYPFVGVKVISELPLGAALQYHALMNDGSQGDISTYGGFSKDEKWLAMTEFFGAAGPGDISHSIGLKNLPMRSQDSVEMTLVIALAEDQSLLDRTIAETENQWFAKQAVNIPESEGPSLQVFPNPFQSALHVSWNAPGEAQVSLIDALGRTVAMQNVHGSSCEFPTLDLTHGFYIIDVEVAGHHFRRRVVASE